MSGIPTEFTCSLCGGSFTVAWTDEQARAEAAENFPGVSVDQMAVVCDVCFREVMDWARSVGLKN